MGAAAGVDFGIRDSGAGAGGGGGGGGGAPAPPAFGVGVADADGPVEGVSRLAPTKESAGAPAAFHFIP